MPWRMVARKVPRLPATGRSKTGKITTSPRPARIASPRDCWRGRFSTSRNSPPS